MTRKDDRSRTKRPKGSPTPSATDRPDSHYQRGMWMPGAVTVRPDPSGSIALGTDTWLAVVKQTPRMGRPPKKPKPERLRLELGTQSYVDLTNRQVAALALWMLEWSEAQT